MCGIVGVVSLQNDIVDQVLCRLQRLQYRGYDSAGCVFVVDGVFVCKKVLGKIDRLINAVAFSDIKSHVGVAHTRWATHGEVNLINAHPHVHNGIAVVHNGIVENAAEVQDVLHSKGVFFKTQTDTEVILKLLEYYIMQCDISVVDALHKITQELTGTFTILVTLQNKPDSLFALKRGSGLVIAKKNNACIVASDVYAVHNFADTAIYLEDNDIAVVSCDEFIIYNNKAKVQRDVYSLKDFAFEEIVNNHESFMMNEILQQPKMISDILQKFNFEAVKSSIKLSQISCISIIACGSSFFAGLIACRWIEEYWGIRAKVEIASEFMCKGAVDDQLFILISQSGETADTICALKKIRQTKSKIMAFVNVPGSTIARCADVVIKTNAGAEFSVAATKTFTAQLLAFLCLILTQIQDPNPFFDAFAVLATKVQEVITVMQKDFKDLTKIIASANGILYTGRGLGYCVAKEGALKMKELSYIMTEAIATGELKHGTIALVDKNLPVVVIAPHDQLFDKVFSNIQEIHSRGGKLIIFTDAAGKKKLSKTPAYIFQLPRTCGITMPIVYVVAMQLFAYYTAKEAKRDIDHPRNLAKSITVE